MRVIAPDVGGGFGGKLQFTPEEVLTVIAARRTGKPCKYTESRSESLMVAHHGRDQWQRLTLAADAGRHRDRPEGRPAGRHGRLPRAGHVGHPVPGRPDVQRDLQVPGVPLDVHERVHQQGVDGRLPRRRAAGGDVRDRTADGRARPRAGHGPARAAREELDQARGVPLHHRCGAARTTPATTRPRPQRPRSCSATTPSARSRKKRRSSSDPVQLGIGISTFTEMCGLAPSALARRRWATSGGGWEHATVRVLPTGKVEVLAGTSPHGQGHETVWSQIVADKLGVPFEDVEVLHGDTQVRPAGWTRTGRGPGRLAAWRSWRPPTRSSRRHGRSPLTCSRPTPTTSSSPAEASECKGRRRPPGFG